MKTPAKEYLEILNLLTAPKAGLTPKDRAGTLTKQEALLVAGQIQRNAIERERNEILKHAFARIATAINNIESDPEGGITQAIGDVAAAINNSTIAT